MTDVEVSARRPNRRGQATRDAMLDAAVTSLASGDPGSVSGNRIAKDIGATWGAIKYQFGDIDGLWAAVLRRTAERRGDLPVRDFPSGTPIGERVRAVVDLMYEGLTAPDSRAIETLRAALPRDAAELERLYPQTAAEFASWSPSWNEACQRLFGGLGVDPARVHEVAEFLPGAMRGLVSEKQLGSYSDLDVARRGLASAIVAYLDRSAPDAPGADRP
ncbi:TetR/AcrR family transcriptional regulator [Gordonia sp. VNK1]|uniref:TetR/AcrR family transcriptional regulator n=1 Tax=Gordonia oleivorans TaxID=3156618 RepID=UPI0032B3EED4